MKCRWLAIAILFLASCRSMNSGSSRWDSVDAWAVRTDGKSTLQLESVPGTDGNGLRINYDLLGGGWCLIAHQLEADLTEKQGFSFLIKTNSNDKLEYNIVDGTGELYHRVEDLKGKYRTWTKRVIRRRNTEYGWNLPLTVTGGKPEFQLAVSGSGKGTIWLDKIGYATADEKSTFLPVGPILDPDRKLPGIGKRQRRDPKLNPEHPGVLEWLKQVQDTSSPEKQLLSSQGDDNVAQTFNNALVAMAFILKGERQRAERILDFFAKATVKENDDQFQQNFYYRGEPRGFFQNVNLRSTEGQPAYHCLGNSDRWMGDMAWLLFAYKYYAQTYQSDRYQHITKLLRDLLISWYCQATDGPGGYVQHGWRNRDQHLHEPYGHPEGNFDAYAVMRLCDRKDLAKQIRIWLERKARGTSLPLDLYSWRVLAYGTDAAPLLDIPEFDLRYRKTLTFNGKRVTGFYPFAAADVDNIWSDGLGHMACAYLTMGDKQRGNYYANQMDGLLIDLTINGEKIKSLPYTANRTGEFGWVDSGKGFVSAAAWYIFAKNRFNPMLTKTDKTK